MRYDKLLTQLDRARTAYEDTVRGLLANAAKEDAQVAEALKSIKDPKGRAAKSAAWTPARRRKQSRLMKKRRLAEKKAKQ